MCGGIMWVGDNVKVFKSVLSKGNKYKSRFVGCGIISEYVGLIGLNDETSIFIVTMKNGEKLEVSDDKLELLS